MKDIRLGSHRSKGSQSFAVTGNHDCYHINNSVSQYIYLHHYGTLSVTLVIWIYSITLDK